MADVMWYMLIQLDHDNSKYSSEFSMPCFVRRQCVQQL